MERVHNLDNTCYGSHEVCENFHKSWESFVKAAGGKIIDSI